MLGLFLASLTMAASLVRPKIASLPPVREQFDPLLAGLDSIEELMFVLEAAHPSATALQRLDAADALLRRRFVHGYSFFRFDQNWAAAALRFIWEDLASPVRPDDILRFRRAACSQQSIVFQELANQLGFEFATVAVPTHFMSAVMIQGQWWVFDANQEVRVRRYPLAWLLRGDPRMEQLYPQGYGQVLRSYARSGQIRLRDVNRNPAPQATLLHQMSALLSHYGWIAALTFWGLLRLAASSAVPLRAMPKEGYRQVRGSGATPWATQP